MSKGQLQIPLNPCRKAGVVITIFALSQPSWHLSLKETEMRESRRDKGGVG